MGNCFSGCSEQNLEDFIAENFEHPWSMANLSSLICELREGINTDPPEYRKELDLYLGIFDAIEVQLEWKDKAGEDTSEMKRELKEMRNDAEVAYRAIKSNRKKRKKWLLFAFLMGIAI
jgi:hypothetical protein